MRTRHRKVRSVEVNSNRTENVPKNVAQRFQRHGNRENEVENVRMRRTKLRSRNSLATTEVERPEPTDRWKRVSADDSDIYILWNAPVEVLVIPCRNFVFGQVEGGDERSDGGECRRWNGWQRRLGVNLSSAAGNIVTNANICKTRTYKLPVSSDPATKYPERPR